MHLAPFLIERLENAGLKHVFGIPGDYVLDFYRLLSENENIEVINNTDEAHSGFAADFYARVMGIGCVCVTYNVGASKVINAVQCAYAERSPLVVISGAPGMQERGEGVLLHHMVGSFNSQAEMFEHITCDAVVLDDPSTACYKIDHALECLKHYKRPVYIEIPRDMVRKTVVYDVYDKGTPVAPTTVKATLDEAILEVKEWLPRAKKPAILAGVEIARYGLGEKLIKFAERTNIPVATTLLAKSVINERHDLFAGIYSGSMSHDHTKKIVEESDCLIMLGVMLTDMTLCFKPSKFDKRQAISSSVSGLRIKSHAYPLVHFSDFTNELFKLEFEKWPKAVLPKKDGETVFEPKDEPIGTTRFFEKVDSVLDRNMAILADVGDALFGAADLTVHHSNHFISPAFYTSMGAAIPGAIGVQVAKPDVRPIVIVGDGASQMSLLELSTAVSRGLNPIVFILNNHGFTTERFLIDGPFNDIHDWDYHKITEIIKGGTGYVVETEIELDNAISSALDSSTLTVINVLIKDCKDVSHGLRRLAEALSERL